MSIFTQVQKSKVHLSTFDLSHDRKFSTDPGRLTPILMIDTVPNDRWHFSSAVMVRFAPLLAPIMARVDVLTEFFFIPNRLVWSNWEKWISGGYDGEDASVKPYVEINLSTVDEGCWADYAGLPLQGNYDAQIDAIPLACAIQVMKDYYLDENFVDLDSVDNQCVDGDNSSNLYFMSLFDAANAGSRSWRKDYFTSALPWTQRGPEATIPLGTSAPLVFDDTATTGTAMKEIAGGGSGNQDLWFNEATIPYGSLTDSGFSTGYQLNVTPYTNVDLTSATASSIIDVRRAYALQSWLEKNARSGVRYIELIEAHFGARSSDARLQRAEYIGGYRGTVNISEVLQTSNNDTQTTPQGTMAGHGIHVGNTQQLDYYCEEFGWILGLLTIMPRADYYQGIPKRFQRFDKFDYPWPSFAHIGEEAIYLKEIYNGDFTTENESVFGYTPRYASWKWHENQIAGAFKSSLRFWAWPRVFDDYPALGNDFIECIPTSEIFAVEEAEHCYCHVYHDIKVKRPIPYMGIPKIY